MGMEYIKYSDISANAWNQYIDKINGITFNYTAQWLSFCLEYSTNIISDESFLVLENQRPIAAALVYIEEISGKRQISWNDGYCQAPYIDNGLEYRIQEKYAKKILSYIDGLAEQYQCTKIMLKADPLGNPGQQTIFYNYNFLLKHGYMDESGMTQLIDLRKTKEDLYADVRKGHKSDMKKGRIYDVQIYDKDSMTEDLIERYKEIYEEDAGRVTRNSELYRFYLDFIRSGMGLAAFGKIDGKEVGVALVTMYKNTAYYSSYAELETELSHVPIGHILQWEIINYLKDHGIAFYEMGEQVYGKTHYSVPEEKIINISNFKRGFGGYTVPFWRGVKYLDGTSRTVYI